MKVDRYARFVTYDPRVVARRSVEDVAGLDLEPEAVAVLNNPGKNPLFTVAERVEMLQEVVRPLGNVSVATFDGLMVEFARQQGYGRGEIIQMINDLPGDL